jgi:hypothetical protein
VTLLPVSFLDRFNPVATGGLLQLLLSFGDQENDMAVEQSVRLE